MKKLIGIVTVIVFAAALCCGLVVGFLSEAPEKYVAVRYVDDDVSEDGYASIYMDSNDTALKIVAVGDPQIEPQGRYSYVGADNDKTFLFLEKYLTASKPDLFIINGDLVHGILISNYPFMVQYAEMFERLGIYWCFTFGNHDCEKEYSGAGIESAFLQPTKKALLEEMEKYEHCMNYDIPTGDERGGDCNFVINLRSHDGELLQSLFFMDCVYSQVAEPSYEREPTGAQIDWYENQIKQISDAEYGVDGGRIKSSVYLHVPLPEAFTGYKEAFTDGKPNGNYRYGATPDGNYSGESEMFEKVLELGSTEAMFFAHFHSDDSSVLYKDVLMTFVQHGGFSHNYRTEGDKKAKTCDFSFLTDYGDKRGGTVTTVYPDGKWTVTPEYAAELLPDYGEITIDYDAVKAKLLAEGWTLSGL